jgi:hypothetical protein
MSQALGLTASKDRRCARCRQVFCRIGVDADGAMKAGVGARA